MIKKLGLTDLGVVNENVSHFISDNEPSHGGVMLARQSRCEVLAAVLGETKRNMMRPTEIGCHWFLMRVCMPEEQSLVGALFMSGDAREGKGSDK